MILLLVILELMSVYRKNWKIEPRPKVLPLPLLVRSSTLLFSPPQPRLAVSFRDAFAPLPKRGNFGCLRRGSMESALTAWKGKHWQDIGIEY